MANPRICERCGKPVDDFAPSGLCPHCLLESSPGFGLAESANDATEPSRIQNPTLRYFGDYEILEEIARGGMGVVYKARQVSLNRTVAVKMILAGQLASPAEVQRFRHEAEAAAHLQHPNIVAIHEVGEHEGQHYFSMDYVEGKDLAELVREGPLPAQRAAAYVQTIAVAVEYAHQKGIVHRDLKPSNVLIDGNDQPRVTDFGLAKRTQAGSGVTLTGAVMGTPSYMSPEQASGKSKEAGPLSDVYSLGAILYELLVSRPPFRAETPLETMAQVVNAEPVGPRLLNRSVPRDLETIALKCLEKQPARRYKSARELAEELGRFLRGEPIHARPISVWGRAARWARRRPAIAALLAAVTVMTAGGVAGILWQWRQAEAARRTSAENAAAAERAQRAEAKESYATRLALAKAKSDSGESNRAREILESCPAQLRHWEWGRLQWLCDTGPKTLEGPWRVEDLMFTPDGQRLVTGGARLIIWNIDGDRRLATVDRATSDVTATGLAVTDDGGQIITAGLGSSSRGTRHVVHVAHAASGRLLHRFAVTNQVELLSRNGSRAFVRNSTNGTDQYTIWEPATGRAVGFLKESGYFHLRAVSPSGKWALTQAIPDWTGDLPRRKTGSLPTQRLRIWAVGTGQPVAILPDAVGILIFAAFSPDGKKLFTQIQPPKEEPRLKQSYAALWETETGRLLARLPLYLRFSPYDYAAVFSANAERLMIAGGLSPTGVAVEVWDTRTATPVATLPGHARRPKVIALSPDGTIALTAEDVVRLWDVSEGVERSRLEGHIGKVLCAAFSPDGRRVATGGEDKTARIWNVQPSSPFLPLGTNLADIEQIGFVDEGRQVYARTHESWKGGVPSVFTRWDTDTGRQLSRTESTNVFDRGQLSSDGGCWFAWDHSGKEIQAWEPSGSRILHRFMGDAVEMTPEIGRIVGFTKTELPEGEHQFAYTVSVWDATNGTLLSTERLRGLDFRLLNGGSYGLLWNLKFEHQLLDLRRNRVLATIAMSGVAWGDAPARFFPQQERLLVQTSQRHKQKKFGALELLDVKSGRVIGSLELESGPDNTGPITEIAAVSGQGDYFLLNYQFQGAHRIWLWESSSGRRQELLGHSGAVTAAVFFPDGRRVVTIGEDHAARVWDTDTGRELIVLPHSSPVSRLAVAPNGRRILTVSRGWGAVIWTAAEWKVTETRTAQ